MISKELRDRLTRLVNELYKQHTDRSTPVMRPDGVVKHFTFRMHHVTNLCGTAGCAIGLDYQLQGITFDESRYDKLGIDVLMENENYYASANAIFYGFGDEYACGNNLTCVKPGRVANRIEEFLNDPDEFERLREQNRKAITRETRA